MKKILSIFASLALVGSSTSTLVACQNNKRFDEGNRGDDEPAINELNQLNNLIGAAASEARAMIIDNEYGVSQTRSNAIINDKLASDFVDGFVANDAGLTNKSKVKSLVETYLVENKNQYRNLNSENVHLGNSKGVDSGLKAVLGPIFGDDFMNAIGTILPILKANETLLSGESIVGFLNQIINDKPDDGLLGLLLSVLEGLDAKETIDAVKPFSPVISRFFKSLFSKNDIFNNIRSVNETLFDSQSPEFLEKSLYDESYSETIPAVGKIPVNRIKTELMLSITRIIKLIFVVGEEKDDFFKTIEPGSDLEVSLILANLLSNALVSQSWPVQEDLTKNLTAIVQEVFRLMTILNAYFSLFDEIKTFNVKDSKHLFSDELNNYEFISKTLTDKNITTLGDSDYVKDKAINLNYFIANLDYYFGSMTQQNDQSSYRAQQGLFLLLNDPVKDYKEHNGYDNKYSYLTDMLLDTFLIIGAKSSSGNTRDVILSIFNDPVKKRTLSESLLRPLILGTINGEDLSTLLPMIKGTLKLLQSYIPELILFQDQINDIVRVLDQMKNIYDKDTLHQFLVGDLRSLFNGNKVLNEDLLNRWFEPNQKVNLQTLLGQPFAKVLKVFDLSILGMESNPLGENIFNKSLPMLISMISNYANKLNSEFDPRTAAYKNGDDKLTSLSTLNLDLPNVKSLIGHLIGDNNGDNNVLSIIVEAAFSNGDNVLVKRLGLNLQKVLMDLGMTKENTFKKDSFFGNAFKLFLPLADQGTGEEFTLTSDSYKIDLVGLWINNVIDLLSKLNETVNYDGLISRLVASEATFNIKVKPEDVQYFITHQSQIQKVKFSIEFVDPLTLNTTNYIFRLERKKIGRKYNFYQITSDKTKGKK